MNYVNLGKITAPVGIKGEVRVYPYIEMPGGFEGIETVFLGSREYVVENIRHTKRMAVIKLRGIDNRNAAEALRNRDISIPRDRLLLAEDTYLIEDLVGLEVLEEDGMRIGRLAEVISGPAQDLYRIEKDEGGDFLLPAVAAFIKDVDVEGGVMSVSLIEGLES